MDTKIINILEKLIDPDPNLRDQAVEDLGLEEGFQAYPLAVYLLATRLIDPDLETRFHAVMVLGTYLDFERPSSAMPDRSLKILVEFTSQFDKEQLIKLLEVSVTYLAAEEAIYRILKLCSYAGKGMGGIVNDRKQSLEIRQQAIFYCGEVGFLGSVVAIRNFVQRVEKDRARKGVVRSGKKQKDQESLYPFAISALGKLQS